MTADATSDKSNRRSAIRFGIRSLFLVLTVLAVLFAAYGWLYRQIIEPRQQANAIEKQLEALAGRRPKGLTPRQWESAVAWTCNLHGNSLLKYQADGPTIRGFEKRLARKLAGNVNLETIHWIWDEYAAICPGGKNYQRFRAVMVDEIEQGGANWGMNVP